MMDEDTFLTKAQTRVLKLREGGLSQAEVARKIGTSRANVCSLEKRAKRNIRRARKTLKLAKKIRSPAIVEIGPDEDILGGAKRLFSAADEAGIRVKLDTPALLTRIQESAGYKLRGRATIEKIELALTMDGDVIVS